MYSGGGKKGFRRLFIYAIFNNVGIAVAVTAMAGIAIAYSGRGHLRSPWSVFRRRKHLLSYQQWKVSIRADVWPFLLGVYGLSSTQEERGITRSQKSASMRSMLNQNATNLLDNNGDNGCIVEDPDSPASEDVIAEESSSAVKESPDCKDSHDQVHYQSLHCAYSDNNEKSSDSDSTEEPESRQASAAIESRVGNDPDKPTNGKSSPSKAGGSKDHRDEDFETWQRIMRLDAVRTNGEWIVYSPTQAVFQGQGTGTVSPIAAIVEDDYEAFWWFVGFMKKARHNFWLDEVGIRRHLNTSNTVAKIKDLPCLVKMQARDCFFVYRMVVVLFRRELIFVQAVCLWEVMWALTRQLELGVTQPGGE
ncbi:hypothetical protein MKW92_037030 [Papaver armeniacum]|nr:hypothetical protein MKW92_037030 [Papaver armeniacum]